MTQSDWPTLAERMLQADGPAALVCCQFLVPVEPYNRVIFPPTFAPDKTAKPKKAEAVKNSIETNGTSSKVVPGKSRYNIDVLKDGSKVALIDSVGSQANRMEPMFADEQYQNLVPQIMIQAGEKIINLLEAGHRAADAIVRYSELRKDLERAFRALPDARPLAKLAPTSVIFGVWDSRGTQVKLPRLVASTIRAYDVEELTRSAQYSPPINYVDEDLFDEDYLETKISKQKTGSKFGLYHVPVPAGPGGVLVHGEIRREAILSLAGLRAVGPKGADGDALRCYLLGLALVAMTYNQEHNLRQGCLLVCDNQQKAKWQLVRHDGARDPFEPDHKAALSFAEEAARNFGVEQKPKTFRFLAKLAAKAMVEEDKRRGSQEDQE